MQLTLPVYDSFHNRYPHRSESEVTAEGGLQRLDATDVALDEDVDAAMPGLGGDPLDADAGAGGAGGVSGAQGVRSDLLGGEGAESGCAAVVATQPLR